MIGSRPRDYACAYVDPVFTSQSYDISISTSIRRTNLSVFLMLIFTSTQFSLAFTCACDCAYTPVKTRLKRYPCFWMGRYAMAGLPSAVQMYVAGTHLYTYVERETVCPGWGGGGGYFLIRG